MQDLNQKTSQAITAKRAAIAEALTRRHYELMPELAARYGERGREKCLQDAHYHLSYLVESIAASLPLLFTDYVAWAKVMLEERGIPSSDLAVNLACLRDALQQTLPTAFYDIARGYVEQGLDQLPQFPSELPSFMAEPDSFSDLAKQYLDALLAGERRRASQLVMEAVSAGASVKEIYLRVFQPSQHEIGRLWQINELSVAQEHYCTAATQLIMSQLYPHLFAAEKNGRVLVATCIGGDLHEIGIRMVSDFFELEGWDTFYLGANTPISSILQTLRERKADALALSATMTFHASAVGEVIAAIRSNEDLSGVKILVGGYPFQVAPELWQKVGADACAGDAQEAVAVANRLIENGARI